MTFKDICIKCGCQKISKAGRTTSSKGYWRQKLKCDNCHRKWIRPRLYPIIKEPFVYQNQVWKKTDWKALTNSQVNEYEMFNELLLELLDFLVIDYSKKVGRPSTRIQDILFCMVTKIYRKLPSRTLSSDLRNAKDLGFIEATPNYSTLMKYFNDQRLKPILTSLIELSSVPISALDEEHFSADSSGFSVSKFGRWFNYKYNKEEEKRIYRKLHLASGSKTNIVTSVVLTNQHGGDSPQLKSLVERTSINFHIKEFSADKAYSSRANLETITNIGAVPYIPFRSNTGGGKNGLIWRKLYVYFRDNPQAFYERYHQRSNIESTFFMIKQKFGDSLMTKNLMANYNEILCKCLAHNLCVLIRAYYEFDLKDTLSTRNPKLHQIKVSI